MVAWLETLPGPVRVAYEAGPTGYGLARACAQTGIVCTVAAPSKIPRAPGDRVKTDRRDAERLARLLRLGELVAVRVPDRAEEAARDLVRAREDARGDLMRARHRLSKLLLRHGLVYEASAWTLAHDAWLRQQRFSSRPLSFAFDESYGAVAQAKGRRDSLDRAIAGLAAEAALRRRRRTAGVPARRLHPDRARADGRARRLAALPAAVTRPLPGTGAERGLLGRATPPGGDHEDRQHARTSPARRGRLAPAPAAARERRARAAKAGAAGGGPGACRRERAPAAPALARARGPRQAAHDRGRRRRTRARRPLLGAGDDALAAVPQRPGEESAPAQTRGATRGTAMSSPSGHARP